MEFLISNGCLFNWTIREESFRFQLPRLSEVTIIGLAKSSVKREGWFTVQRLVTAHGVLLKVGDHLVIDWIRNATPEHFFGLKLFKGDSSSMVQNPNGSERMPKARL